MVSKGVRNNANHIYIQGDEEAIALAKKRATSLAISWGEYGNSGFVYVTVSSEIEARDEKEVDFGLVWRDGTSSRLLIDKGQLKVKE
jgi:hypothetical protein